MSKLAFVFPGQGSQKVGMLSGLAAEYSVVQQSFNQASEVLGYDLWSLVQEGPQESLNQTERTQPMLLTASVALWRAWQENSEVKPEFMAGHSLGEWSALVCAGVIDFEVAVKLVQLRGKYMQEAVPEGVGSMAAIIGLDDDAILAICKQVEADRDGEVVSAVNFNSPGQVVIAGHVEAINQACELCKEKGAKRAMPLAVSAPFHSSLLRPAADKLEAELEQVTFNTPQIAVVHNVNAGLERDPGAIKQLMIEQIYKPVRWVDCVKCLAANGVTIDVECGPGKVLSGLVKRIDRNVACLSIDMPDGLTAASEQLK